MVLEDVSPGGDHVALDVIFRGEWAPVIFLEDSDEVGDSEHADEVLGDGIPQWSGANSMLHQREERCDEGEEIVDHVIMLIKIYMDGDDGNDDI